MKLSGVIPALILFVALLVIAGLVWLGSSLFGTSEPRGEGAREGVFGSLFPFGRGGAPNDVSGEPERPVDGPVPRVRRVTDAPVAGALFAETPKGTVVRYVERDTGHWYETPVDAYTNLRLTNTTIPGIQDALPLSSTTILLRTLGTGDAVETFLGSYTSTTTDASLEGVLLNSYTRVDGDPTGVVGVRTLGGGSVVEFVPLQTGVSRVVFSSFITSWVPETRNGKIFLASAPAGGVPGAWYELSGGTLTRLVGGLPGLEVTSNSDASRTLVSRGAQSAASLYVYDHVTRVLTTLPLSTLVGKCVWDTTSHAVCAVPRTLPSARYPTDWHLGRVATADDLWRIDTSSGITTLVASLEEETGTALDAHRLAVSDDGAYVTLVNKLDGGLWLARVAP